MQPTEDLSKRLNVREVRRAFEAACAEPSATSQHLYQETAVRLSEHLSPIRISPRRVLDIGSGLGQWSSRLEELYPTSELILSDFVTARLKPLQRRRPWFGRRPPRSVAMDGPLAIQAGSLDLITSNLVFHWVGDQPAFVRACSAALRPGGLLMLSTLGAATLSELRNAWAAHDPDHVHVHPFADMHDIGDQLVREGFTNVVMDSQRVVLTYAGPESLLHELRSLEGGNLSTARAPGLTTPRRLQQVCKTYRAQTAPSQTGSERDPHGDELRIDATVELVFAHAWAGETAPASQEPALQSVDVPLPTLPRR